MLNGQTGFGKNFTNAWGHLAGGCLFLMVGFAAFWSGLYFHFTTIEHFYSSQKRGMQLLQIERDLRDLSMLAAKVHSFGYADGGGSADMGRVSTTYEASYSQLKNHLHIVEKNMKAQIVQDLDDTILFHVDASKSSLFSFHWTIQEMFEAFANGKIQDAAANMSLAESHYEKFAQKVGLAIDDLARAKKASHEEQSAVIESQRAYFALTVILAVLSGIGLLFIVVSWVRKVLAAKSGVQQGPGLRVGGGSKVRLSVPKFSGQPAG